MKKKLIFLVLVICSLPLALYSQKSKGKPQSKEVAETTSNYIEPLSDCSGFDAVKGWVEIMKILRDNAEEYSKKNTANSTTILMSQQLLYLGEFSYENRKETGGWAGEFIKTSFLSITSDIKKDSDWFGTIDVWGKITGNETSEKIRELKPDITQGQLEWLTLFVKVGKIHVARHLAPAFECYFSENLGIIAKNKPSKTKLELMKTFLLKAKEEHEKFFLNALGPGFDKLMIFWTKLEPGWGFRSLPWNAVFGQLKIESISAARETRKDAIERALVNLFRDNRITKSEYKSIALQFGKISL